jgi:hypothetical protein
MVRAQNTDLLDHTGLVSVQLQPPTNRIDEQTGATVSASPAPAPVTAPPTRPALPAANGSGG